MIWRIGAVFLQKKPRTDEAFLRAFLCSLGLHLFLFFTPDLARWFLPQTPAHCERTSLSVPPLTGRLLKAEARLSLEERFRETGVAARRKVKTARAKKPRRAPPRVPGTLWRLNAEVERQMAALARQEGFYPEIARQNRWEGESLVRIFFSENGAVLAVRIEESSGIPVLDDAALKAARALKSLPAEGLELDSLLLPVRFQLRPIPKNISE